MERPFSESCEQNKGPLLAVLTSILRNSQRVLEVGSGTGQHAVWFGRHLEHLQWQTTELTQNHAGIHAWLAEASDNVLPPLELEVCRARWAELAPYDAVFSANTTHIMPWPAVKCLFAGVGILLPTGGVFALYGPFNYEGRYTSESNARFDDWLKQRDPASGIRDFEALDELADRAGMVLMNDFEMPANNRTLVWRKR